MRDIIFEHAYKTGMLCDGTPDAWDDNAIDKFALSIVDECIDAVKNTSTTGAHTTYEVDLIQATLTEAVKSIEKRFSRTV
jgi:hypothetical protein